MSLTPNSGRPPDPSIGRLPRQLRGFLSATKANPEQHRCQALVGDAGTGKTAAVHSVRLALDELGMRVATHVDAGLKDYDAVVIDDGHLLPDDKLDTVATIAAAGNHTVVFACEPRHRKLALTRTLATLQRDAAPVHLEPLTREEISARLTDTTGSTAPSTLIDHIQALTGGNRGFVDAAIAAIHGSAGGSPKTVAKAVERAMRERLYALDESEVATVLLCSLRIAIGTAELISVLGASPSEAEQLIDSARCTGLIDGPAEWSERVYSAAVGVIGHQRRYEIESSLLANRLEQGPLSGPLALQLASHGIADPQLVPTLLDAAAGAKPTQATAFYDAAARISSETVRTRLLAAESRACAGDLTGATRTVDSLWDNLSDGTRPLAVRIVASASAIRGNARRASELYCWLAHTSGVDDVMAAAVHVSIGNTAAGRKALEDSGAPAQNPPHTRAAVDRLVLEGLVESIDAPASNALNTLMRASALERGTAATTTPDRSAAMAATLAIHLGKLPKARAVLAQHSVDDIPPLHRVRHQLLLAWVTLFEGDVAAASAQLDRLGQSTMHLRDQLSRGGLRVALARRSGDFGELRSAWEAVQEPLSEYSVDLCGLLPIGEIWVAAARLQVLDELAPTLEQLQELLSNLGNPPSWSASMHWYGVHAAIAGDSPSELVPHAQALAEAARTSPYAATLARAGRVWIHMLGGNIDPADVETAARGLADVGHSWDGSRLASQAALYSSDSRVASTMLQLARSLRTHQNPVTETSDAPAPQSPAAQLSEREREVVSLLLLGITYKDIGDRLFISAKTVEHHVARIRRRIGANSRAEMLSVLRAMQADSEP
ncbi:helix-turn-helix transcriptional regulator [Nocardia sp. 348MFTsu5.1]|uniref:helix-turn-helix domain-containing protein n=1 Tax=Nocardia sp. 348MFTsu5.1 TaxID=1172185 RepID=UPI00036B594F|nr:helix-turn-helix transcriptional regulator [Nocardia sp. 348MFTsu5.1]